MTLPPFYDPDRVGTRYVPDAATVIAEGQQSGLPKAGTDERRILLLLVDAQVDFIHDDGALSVPGAVDDTRRTVEWILRHAGEISAIAASLDSHLPYQIFHPTWWTDAQGKHPEPFTPIQAEEVDGGRWKPLFDPDWSVAYVHRLEEDAKKELMIWPFHTMIGTPGHTITPTLYEAILYHSAARGVQPKFVMKGTIAKTEYYSILEPEIKVPEDPRGELNREFLDELLGYDAIYVAGQAKSHCVLETITSIMRYHGDDRETVEKIHLLTDCTSSVQHPEVDFEALANEAYARFQRQGLQVVKSTDPLG